MNEKSAMRPTLTHGLLTQEQNGLHGGSQLASTHCAKAHTSAQCNGYLMIPQRPATCRYGRYKSPISFATARFGNTVVLNWNLTPKATTLQAKHWPKNYNVASETLARK
jgi:hypothetical protein